MRGEGISMSISFVLIHARMHTCLFFFPFFSFYLLVKFWIIQLFQDQSNGRIAKIYNEDLKTGVHFDLFFFLNDSLNDRSLRKSCLFSKQSRVKLTQIMLKKPKLVVISLFGFQAELWSSFLF